MDEDGGGFNTSRDCVVRAITVGSVLLRPEEAQFDMC